MRFAGQPVPATSITFAPVDLARGQMADGPVMEIATFHLNPGISDADFLAAAQGTEVLVAAQPGFVRRNLLRDDAGQWTDTIEWQGLGLAHAAARTLMSDPAFAPFGAAIDMAGLSMRHIPILWQMGD